MRRHLDGVGVDVYVSTSSAGGGLQMMVAGVVKQMTGESAERAALGAGAIEPGIQMMVDGVLDIAVEPDVLFAALIVIDTDAARLEKLTGTLGANPDANCGFNLETDGGDRSIGYDAGTRAYVVSDSGSDQVSVDALPDGAVTDVYGEEAINGCFDAETIIAFQ